MKVITFIICIVAILASVYCYRIGYAQGQEKCPVKYAVCENGTCVLSDSPPDYSGK
jgi:hypothetical protein